MRVTRAWVCARPRAAYRPPNPPPAITTLAASAGVRPPGFRSGGKVWLAKRATPADMYRGSGREVALEPEAVHRRQRKFLHPYGKEGNSSRSIASGCRRRQSPVEDRCAEAADLGEESASPWNAPPRPSCTCPSAGKRTRSRRVPWLTMQKRDHIG